MEVLRGATWWEFFQQTSRSSLNQKVRDQIAGKPTFRGQQFRVNQKKQTTRPRFLAPPRQEFLAPPRPRCFALENLEKHTKTIEQTKNNL